MDLIVDVDANGKGAAVHEGVTVVIEGYESRPLEFAVVGSIDSASGTLSASAPPGEECRVAL